MDVNDYINNDIIFDAKAAAVPYNYRISYKIALICSIIGKCCGKKRLLGIKAPNDKCCHYKQKSKR